MPYEIRNNGAQYCVYKKGTNKKFGCHATKEGAQKQMEALYAKEQSTLEIRISRTKAVA